MKLHKKSHGFGAIGLLIVLTVIGLVCTTGWYVYDRNKENVQETNTTEQKQNSLPNTQPLDTYTPPEGWARYEDAYIAFSYPGSWSIENLDITRVQTDDYLLAPLGGGGGGKRFKLNKSEKIWEVFEPTGKGDFKLYSGFDEPLVPGESINDIPVFSGQMGEGSAVTHYILFSDGEYSYQLRLPLINDPTEQNPELYEKRKTEQANSLQEIIGSLTLK